MADRLKALENFVLLILGAIDRPISVLHLEKEIFLLWNFHQDIHNYLNFIKHYKGPYSEEIAKIIHHPFYLNNCWEYRPPIDSNDLGGGYVELTDTGRLEYKKFYSDAKKRESLLPLLSGIKMVRELYDNLSSEELLLLIYSTYPEYTEFSKIYKDIERKKKPLAKNLLIIGLIDDKRFEEITIGA
jgi:uncharacterized protein YwgA